jgi:hypothetical protein
MFSCGLNSCDFGWCPVGPVTDVSERGNEDSESCREFGGCLKGCKLFGNIPCAMKSVLWNANVECHMIKWLLVILICFVWKKSHSVWRKWETARGISLFRPGFEHVTLLLRTKWITDLASGSFLHYGRNAVMSYSVGTKYTLLALSAYACQLS